MILVAASVFRNLTAVATLVTMRFVKVLLILLALAATSGAVVGFLSVVVLQLWESSALSLNPRLYGAAAAIGGIVGSLIGLPMALLFLRRVPLWRATVETAAAAGIGSAVGGLVPVPVGWLYGAAVFALAAALRLRYVYRPTKETAQRD